MIYVLQSFRWLVFAALVAVFAGPFAWGFVTGDTFMTVTGESMEPTYRVGDILLVQSKTGTELNTEGDIVVATLTPGDLNTQYVHRVHSLTEGGAILKGDNNDQADPGVVTPAHVVGSPRTALTGAVAVMYDLTQWWVARAIGIIAVLVLLLISPRARRRPHPTPSTELAEVSLATAELPIATGVNA